MDQRAPAPHKTQAELAEAGQRLKRRLAIAGMLFSVLIFGSNFAISRHAGSLSPPFAIEVSSARLPR